LKVWDAVIKYGTINSLTIGSLTTSSVLVSENNEGVAKVYAEDVRALQQLIVGATGSLPVSTSVDPNDIPIFVVSSGSSGETLFEVGSYTRVAGEGETNPGAKYPSGDSSSSLAGGTGYYIWLQSGDINVDATGNDFVGDKVNATGQLSINELVEPDDYVVEFTVYVSASWNSSFTPGANSNVAEIYEDSMIFIDSGRQSRTWTNKPVSHPTRTGDTLYIRTYVEITATPGVA